MIKLFHQHLTFALITQTTKFILAFKYLAEFFRAFLPQPFAYKESVFSFKLFKQCHDCFFSTCKLITINYCRKQFLIWMQKKLQGRVVMEQKPHVSFHCICIKNILYRNIYLQLSKQPYFLSSNIEKGTMLITFRRIEDFPTPGQRFSVKFPTPGTGKMTNARQIPRGREGEGDGHAWN